MAEKFSKWVLSHHKIILVIGVLLTIIMGAGIKNLTFSNNYQVYFDEDNAQLQAYQHLTKTYTSYDTVLFVLEPKDGNIFTKKNLAAVQTLTKKAWHLPWAGRVDSLSNYSHIRANGDELIVAPFFDKPDELTPEKLRDIRQNSLSDKELVGRLISDKGHVAAVNTVIYLPRKDGVAEIVKIKKKVDDLVAEIQKEFPDMKIYLTGMIMLNDAFLSSAWHDLTTLLPLSLLVIISVLLTLICSRAGTLASLIVVVMCTAVTMGIAGWMGFVLTPTSAPVPVLILTLVVANVVHILCGYQDALCWGEAQDTALAETLRINLHPIFITTLTTVIGFLSLNFNDTPPMRDFGNIATIGMITTYLMTVTFLPALIKMFPGNIRREQTQCGLFTHRLGQFVVKHRHMSLLIVGIMFIGLFLNISKNELNDEYVKYFDKSVDFRRSTEFLMDNLTGIYQLHYSIKANGSGGVQEPEFLKKVEELVEWLREQPEVRNVSSIIDVMKHLNKTLNGDEEKWFKLPDSRAAAAQFLLIYESSLPVGLDINHQVDVDKSATRVEVTLGRATSKQIVQFNEQVQQWMAKNLPEEMRSIGASPALMFAMISEENIPRILKGVLISLVLISLIMMYELKSIKFGLISLIPNLIPIGMAFGVWGLFKGEIGMAVAMIASMTIGIVVDDTVHFLSKYMRARREYGYNALDSVQFVFSTVGTALLVTSIVLIAGFLVLAFSPFNANADMGILCALTIGFALIADLFLLPPLVMLIDK